MNVQQRIRRAARTTLALAAIVLISTAGERLASVVVDAASPNLVSPLVRSGALSGLGYLVILTLVLILMGVFWVVWWLISRAFDLPLRD